MKSRRALGLIGWASLTFGVAALGALASVDAAAFYAQLARPSWAPPGWLFAPVWSALYALMALSAWLVWRERGFAGARRRLLCSSRNWPRMRCGAGCFSPGAKGAWRSPTSCFCGV